MSHGELARKETTAIVLIRPDLILLQTDIEPLGEFTYYKLPLENYLYQFIMNKDMTFFAFHSCNQLDI